MNIAYKLFLVKIKYILNTCYKQKKEKIKILDLGCGDFKFNPILKCGFNDYDRFVGIDAFKFNDNYKNKNIQVQFINQNIFDMTDNFDEKSFDIVFALDLIEHLTEENGEKLLSFMKSLAVYNVIVFTPNGFLKQEDSINKFNCHLSGWEIDYFKKKGYKSYPMMGDKIFRKEFCELKSPKFITGPLSLISNLLFTKFFPNRDFALLHKLDVN